jgi:hypothetical protein
MECLLLRFQSDVNFIELIEAGLITNHRINFHTKEEWKSKYFKVLVINKSKENKNT